MEKWQRPTPIDDHPGPGVRGGAGRQLAWAGALVMVGFCGLTGFLVYQCSPAHQAQSLAATAGKIGDAAAAGAAKIIAAIKANTATTTFREHLDSIKPDLDGRLLVAEGQATEDFRRDSTGLFGTSFSEIRAPVTYHYFVALSGNWEMQLHEGPDGGVTGEVVAPELQPLPNPALDTAAMEVSSGNGWLRWDKNDLQNDLLREITPALNRRATQKLPQYFPVARAGVEKFVREWMLREYQLPPGTPIYLHIRFHNEPAPPPLAAPAPKG